MTKRTDFYGLTRGTKFKQLHPAHLRQLPPAKAGGFYYEVQLARKTNRPDSPITLARGLNPVQPEKKLWLAVLLEALQCAGGRAVPHEGHGNAVKERRKERSRAMTWLDATYEHPPPGSFEWVCDHLHLSKSKIRQALKK